MVTTYLATALLAVGVAAVVLAYGLLGRDNVNRKTHRLAHRICGYAFAAIFLLVFVGMVGRFAFARSFSTLAMLHAAAALAALSLLAVKFAVARRYKKLGAHLFTLGTALFVVTLTAVGPVIGAGFANGQAENTPVPTQAQTAAPVEISFAFSQNMPPDEQRFVVRCGACHPLGQALIAVNEYRTAQAWGPVIERMRQKTDAITAADAVMIAGYLAQFARQ